MSILLCTDNAHAELVSGSLSAHRQVGLEVNKIHNDRGKQAYMKNELQFC